MSGDVQARFLATLVDEWARCGVTDAVVCPGNRSTLLSALLAQDGRFRVHVMVDERSASFFALGLGLATKGPALFWCTSGTATAEAHAAVIEASHGQVPLLVCTADRPPELHHTRDWQSIDQRRVYGETPRWTFDPGVASDEAASYWRSIAARSVLETTENERGPGPVHLNLPIREPWGRASGELPPGREGERPWHRAHRASLLPPPGVVESLSWGRKGLLVVGRTDADAEAVHRCADALGWPVIADARSGARLPRRTTIAAADAILRNNAFASSHRPDVVLRIGAPVVSKVVAAWLAESSAEEWLSGPHDMWQGPAAGVDNFVACDPTLLCNALAEVATAADTSWLQSWTAAEQAAQSALHSQLEAEGLCEPAVARQVVASAPNGSTVFAATSMPVRDVEWYSAPRVGVNVLANRGASGMDGIVSTAAGVSVATEAAVTLLVGDLTFLYDLNALWVLRGAAAIPNLTIVVVDNNGGGIFSMLPQLNDVPADVAEKVVGTPQNVDLAAAVEGLGVDVTLIADMPALREGLSASYAKAGLKVLVVKSERRVNADVHRRLNEAVVNALG